MSLTHRTGDMGTLDGQDTAWMRHGLCYGTRRPDLWFPELSRSVPAAERRCEGCPVIAACLEYAIAHSIDYGVWGGMGEKRRIALRRRREHPAREARRRPPPETGLSLAGR